MRNQIEITKKQYQAYSLLNQKNQDIEYLTFGGGSGGGKSMLGVYWLLTNCYQFPKTRWFIGRNELKRLRMSTLISWHKFISIYKIPINDFSYNMQDNFIKHKNGSRIDMLDLKYIPSDPLYERFGSTEYTGGWIEEGGEIAFDAYDVLKSRINAHLNDKYDYQGKILVTCNPKKNFLYTQFYKPFKNKILPENHGFIQSLIGDNPKAESQKIEKLKALQNPILRARLLEGKWEYEDEPDQLIKYEWLETLENVRFIDGKGKIGVDVGRGNDLSTLSYIKGNQLRDIECHNVKDNVVVANKTQELMQGRRVAAERVNIDAVGIGSGAYDVLKNREIYVNDFIAGEKMIPNIEICGDYKFKNQRSQMWWIGREMIRKQLISIKLNDVSLKEKLFEDLTAPHYIIDDNNMIQVESKDKIRDRIGRSTDYADSFLQALIVDIMKREVNIRIL